MLGSVLMVGAQDYDTVIRSGEMEEKLVKFEKDLRAEVKEEIAIKRVQALSDLERVLGLHQSISQKEEARLVKIEMNKLKRKMGLPVEPIPEEKNGGVNGKKVATENQYFRFGTEYLFDEVGRISGKFIFRPNNNVRAVYEYEGKAVAHIWEWQDMGDHVQIKTGGVFGKIILSTRPNSELNIILIRWGGELKNILTDAISN
jgi:hypothetical protein